MVAIGIEEDLRRKPRQTRSKQIEPRRIQLVNFPCSKKINCPVQEPVGVKLTRPSCFRSRKKSEQLRGSVDGGGNPPRNVFPRRIGISATGLARVGLGRESDRGHCDPMAEEFQQIVGGTDEFPLAGHARETT